MPEALYLYNSINHPLSAKHYTMRGKKAKAPRRAQEASMFDRIMKWMMRHEMATIIISSVIGAMLGLLAKDHIKVLLQAAIHLLQSRL